MNCPKCGADMPSGFLQTGTLVALNRTRHKLFLNSREEGDVMIARKAFPGTDFPGFLCKACGLVVFDYQHGRLRL